MGKALNYGNYDIFVIMGNAGFISSTVVVRGELSQSSAKILVKLLWYSRLCRPDLAHAISSLAAQSNIWSKNADKQSTQAHVLRAADQRLGIEGVW